MIEVSSRGSRETTIQKLHGRYILEIILAPVYFLLLLSIKAIKQQYKNYLGARIIFKI
jgi:hypothetical protein